MNRTFVRSFAVCLPILAVVSLARCNDGPSSSSPGQATGGQATGPSRAFGIWQPGTFDTCPVEVHDQYAMVGADGKLYPTWHPPVDPTTGCSFGHEHGRSPAGSDLFGEVGSIPFGFANEQLDIYDPTGPRHEDHVGHKVEWANDVTMKFPGDAATSLLEMTCDVLIKMHQGSHSKDAFTNNLHELSYHIRCSDGTRMHVTLLTVIGTPGAFTRSCDRDVEVVVGTPVPVNSPDGGGRRVIPDRTCVEQALLVPDGQSSNFGALRESWEISTNIRRAGGGTLAHFNPYFQVLVPSRFYDPTMPDLVGRPMDVCYEVEANGDRVQGGPCEEATAGGSVLGITYDDPRSPFDGAHRVVDINDNTINNPDGPQVWYTDPFGKNARTEPFPGSIRQFIAAIDNRREINISGPTVARDRDYGTQGVHSPN